MRKYIISILSVVCLNAQTQIGTIKPIYDVQLSVLVDGVVSKIEHKEGDKVKKGSPLLYLDNSLQNLETKRRELIYKNRAKIEALKENLETMSRLIEKKELLYKRTKAVSLNEIEQMKMQYLNMKSEYLTLLNEKKKEKIEYKISSEVLNYYTLKSPVDGQINEIKPKIGEWLQTGNKVIRLIDSSKCFVELDIEANYVKSLKLNDKVKLEVTYDNEVIKKEAKITFISNIADNASGLFRVKVTFDNNDERVLPGVSAKIFFESLNDK